MLDPKEIDTYFNTDTLMKKVSPSKIARHTRKVMLAKRTLPAIAAIMAVTLMVFPSLKDDIKDFGLDSVDQRFVNYFRRRRDWEVCGVRNVTDPSENLNKVNMHTNRTRVYISGCSQIR